MTDVHERHTGCRREELPSGRKYRNDLNAKRVRELLTIIRKPGNLGGGLIGDPSAPEMLLVVGITPDTG